MPLRSPISQNKYDNLTRVLNEYGQYAMTTYQDSLIISQRIASGDLLNTVSFEVEQNGESFEVSLNLMEYWKYIEYGTRPHYPPIQALINWIQVKPILPRDNKITDVRNLAYAIQNKIGRYGTEGSHNLEDVLNSNQNDIWMQRIEEAFADDILHDVEITFKEM